MDKPLRIGIVGWGEIARLHASYFESGGAVLAGVVSRRDISGLKVPVYRKIHDMLPSVDAVCVAVPNYMHASSCLEAVRAGKPVFLEKPLCINEGELLEIEKVLPYFKVPVIMGYRLRWNPSMIRLKSMISGLERISCIYHMDIDWLSKGKAWTLSKKQSGGSLFTIGVHALDLARWLADAKGEALQNIKVSAEFTDNFTEYPLVVKISGTLPSGVKIIAGADLRKGNEFDLRLNVDAKSGCYPDTSISSPVFHDETIEYRSLIHDFIRQAKKGTWNQEYLEEVYQTHRELISACRESEKL